MLKNKTYDYSNEDNDYQDKETTNTNNQSETKLTREERETLYLFNEADGYWLAESTIPKDIRKLEKQNWTEINVQYYKDGSVKSKRFKSPRSCLSPRAYNPDKPKRIVSEEQRQATSERTKKMHEARKKKNNQVD